MPHGCHVKEKCKLPEHFVAGNLTPYLRGKRFNTIPPLLAPSVFFFLLLLICFVHHVIPRSECAAGSSIAIVSVDQSRIMQLQ